MVGYSLVALCGLILLHVFAGKLRFLKGVPRSRWLSLAGGVSVSYVFLHLLPELGNVSQQIRERGFGGGEQLGFLIALVGFVIFYGLERAVRQAKSPAGEERTEVEEAHGVFWLHLASFAVYNIIVGYLLLHLEPPGVQSLGFFAVAMALHFLITDYGMREDFEEEYARLGRWALSAALIAGWMLGRVEALPDLAVGVGVAFLGGGIILNVIKEELPRERQARFVSFVTGVILYSALIMAV